VYSVCRLRTRGTLARWWHAYTEHQSGPCAVYNHVVIFIEENKDYGQIIGNPIIDNSNAPYINQTLRKEGARLTRMFGEEPNSQGAYFWLF
jgi:hypothetical protein